MKREEELTVSVKNLTRPIIGIENRTALEAFDIMVARIEGALAYPNSSPLLPTPKPKTEPVGWETDAEWDLEMRCCNITENTPFAEVSKLINDLWQQYCLAAEPKPEAEPCLWDCADAPMEICPTTGKPCATHPPKPEATEGGAHEKAVLEAVVEEILMQQRSANNIRQQARHIISACRAAIETRILIPVAAFNKSERLEFRSIGQAVRSGFKEPKIHRCLNTPHLKHKGYQWERISTLKAEGESR